MGTCCNGCELNYNPIPLVETESQQITFASKVVQGNKLVSIQLKGIEIFDLEKSLKSVSYNKMNFNMSKTLAVSEMDPNVF